MSSFKFRLDSYMPMLMHADDIEAADELIAWRKDPKNKNFSKAGDDRTPAWTWQTYLYRDEENAIAMPSQNLMVAIRQGAARIILKGNKTFKELSQSGLFIAAENLKFTVNGEQISLKSIDKMKEKNISFDKQADAVRDLGFRLFLKRARIGTAKHIRVRPRFDKWEVSGEIQVLVPEITDEIREQLFEYAGNIGLCDWRPGCKTPGPYGMFTTTWL